LATAEFLEALCRAQAKYAVARWLRWLRCLSGAEGRSRNLRSRSKPSVEVFLCHRLPFGRNIKEVWELALTYHRLGFGFNEKRIPTRQPTQAARAVPLDVTSCQRKSLDGNGKAKAYEPF
jgi:hypothetical protein